MGLTIHYSLTTALTEADEVRDLVDSLRQFARDLPFKEVSELLEFRGEAADYEQTGRDDEHRWLKIQAGKFLDLDGRNVDVKPEQIIAFATWPGDGCEAANFGLCRYPAFVVDTAGAKGRQVPTHLDGWRWQSFCKTQYASDPGCGGVENFLRCHLCVIKLLDFAKSTGLLQVEVSDEGGYWEGRTLEALAREVGQWNEFIAAMAGQMKDAAGNSGVTVESAIAGFANFEHLEAKGLERLQHLREQRPAPKSE